MGKKRLIGLICEEADEINQGLLIKGFLEDAFISKNEGK